MSTRMKLRHVEPDKIQIPEVRVTSIWSEEEYADFAATIKADGIQQPIKCILENGVYWLVDGKHRLDEARLHSIKKVPVVYKEGTIIDALVENLVSNRLRGKTPASDEVRLIKHLQEKYNMEPWQIAERTGLSQKRVEQRLQVGGSAPEVLSCLEFDQIGLGVAFELSRLPNKAGQIALLSRLLQMTPPAKVSEVADIVTNALELQEQMRQPVPEKPPEIPVLTISCHLCGEKYEAADMRGINTCATCHGIARDYIQELKKRRAAKVSPEDVLANRIANADDLEESQRLYEESRKITK